MGPSSSHKPPVTSAATLVSAAAARDRDATIWTDEGGAIKGSATGGSPKGALVDAGPRMLVMEKPGMHGYGISDEPAGEIGMTCGDTPPIFVGALDEHNSGPA
jgi:xanthine/CO dehydrogenase XdhC/CoxF family maturation factor